MPSWQKTGGVGLHCCGFSSHFPFLKLSMNPWILSKFLVLTGLTHPGHSLALHSLSLEHMFAVLMSSKAPSRSFVHSSGLIFEQAGRRTSDSATSAFLWAAFATSRDRMGTASI